MKGLTIRTIASCCGGVYSGPEEVADTEVSDITTDSRRVTRGCLFVAIRGERVDGHTFAQQTVNDGALCVLAEHPVGEEIPCIVVDATLEAIKRIAEYYRAALALPVIGVTGSVGKTSTKEMIAQVLSVKARVLKTDGNFNNELGLPLTIFRLREEHEIAVLEMGISDFGEMHRLAEIARPDICVMTNIGDCHLEQLGDRDGVLRAKSEIFDYLDADGVIVVNGDDERLARISRPQKIVRFGLNSKNDVFADQIRHLGFEGVSCCIHSSGGSFEVQIPVPGEHMVYNALAATAVGLLRGMTTDQIRRGIEGFETIAGRFRVIRTDRLTIIDDCYNANPMSMRASLDVLAQTEGRRVAILGDMGELGEKEEEHHRELGGYAAACGVDVLCCVGARSAGMYAGAKETAGGKTQLHYFGTRDELIGSIKDLVREGDTVLVKASHFMQFDQVVEALERASSE